MGLRSPHRPRRYRRTRWIYALSHDVSIALTELVLMHTWVSHVLQLPICNDNVQVVSVNDHAGFVQPWRDHNPAVCICKNVLALHENAALRSSVLYLSNGAFVKDPIVWSRTIVHPTYQSISLLLKLSLSLSRPLYGIIRCYTSALLTFSCFAIRL